MLGSDEGLADEIMIHDASTGVKLIKNVDIKLQSSSRQNWSMC